MNKTRANQGLEGEKKAREELMIGKLKAREEVRIEKKQ